MSAFVISYISLWILVLALAIGLLAMYYHQGRTISAAHARAGQIGPAIGAAAPRLQAMSLTGTELILGGPRRHMQAVAFTTADCKACELTVRTLADSLNGNRTQHEFCIVCRGAERDVTTFAERHQIPRERIIADTRSKLGHLWDIHAVPFVLVLDSNGVVQSAARPNNLETLKRVLAPMNLESRAGSITASAAVGPRTNGASYADA